MQERRFKFFMWLYIKKKINQRNETVLLLLQFEVITRFTNEFVSKRGVAS